MSVCQQEFSLDPKLGTHMYDIQLLTLGVSCEF